MRSRPVVVLSNGGTTRTVIERFEMMTSGGDLGCECSTCHYPQPDELRES
jgi:hypothetical protein